jgi:ubiquinone/menaquinone biosynthesis C-methylase UbiE
LSEETRRTALLERIRATYRRYEDEGYAQRWTGRETGARLGTEERDRWLVESMRSADAHTVLDLGCGDGNVALTLDRAGLRPLRYIGIDISEARLAVARENVPWGEFRLASADRVPLATGTVDAAVALTLFSSIPEEWFQMRIAAELHRLLRPGGSLLVYDIRYRSPTNRTLTPVAAELLVRLFPGWKIRVGTLTVLPPLARRRIASGRLRYRLLAGVPWLRSHIAATLSRPQ